MPRPSITTIPRYEFASVTGEHIPVPTSTAWCTAVPPVAGCPIRICICDRSRPYDEISAAGIRECGVLPLPADELRTHTSDLPFAT